MNNMNNNKFYKSMGLWIITLAVMIVMVSSLQSDTEPAREVPYTELMHWIKNDRIAEIRIQGNTASGKNVDGEPFTVYIPELLDTEFAGEITEMSRRRPGIPVETREPAGTSMWLTLLIGWAPFLVIIGVWFFIMRQLQSGGKAMSFGKSRARMLTENQQRVTFADVAGVEESKEELEEIIAFLRDPQKFTNLGGRIPKGVLMVGPPGTGKTLLARAVAGEAEVPFFSISGSDFVEMFVGVGASRVRDLFMQGKKSAPCIIFIDEIDAVGRHRGAGLGGGHDEREQTLNQLLVEMDGFESNEGVILIAATNRPDVLDPALLRPGRFDRRVVVPRPDLNGRTKILEVHSRPVPLADDVDVETLARGTPGFVGADLQNLVNEAALLAARKEAKCVSMNDFEQAKDKVLMGAERRSMIMSDKEKKVTAYHEGGHALVAMLTEDSDPVHKVTIIPRGMALGVTQVLPEEDRHSHTRSQLLASIKCAMGGRAAEELVFKHFSTGASNDLQRATALARDMVCHYGMSEKIGPVSFEDESGDVFLGRDMVARQNYSEHTAREIDGEIRNMLGAIYQEALELLDTNRQTLDRIAAALLERETLEAEEVKMLLDGIELPAPAPPATEPAPAPEAAPLEDAPPQTSPEALPGGKPWEPEPDLA